jgi:hypothetical protein
VAAKLLDGPDDLRPRLVAHVLDLELFPQLGSEPDVDESRQANLVSFEQGAERISIACLGLPDQFKSGWRSHSRLGTHQPLIPT